MRCEHAVSAVPVAAPAKLSSVENTTYNTSGFGDVRIRWASCFFVADNLHLQIRSNARLATNHYVVTEFGASLRIRWCWTRVLVHPV